MNLPTRNLGRPQKQSEEVVNDKRKVKGRENTTQQSEDYEQDICIADSSSDEKENEIEKKNKTKPSVTKQVTKSVTKPPVKPVSKPIVKPVNDNKKKNNEKKQSVYQKVLTAIKEVKAVDSLPLKRQKKSIDKKEKPVIPVNQKQKKIDNTDEKESSEKAEKEVKKKVRMTEIRMNEKVVKNILEVKIDMNSMAVKRIGKLITGEQINSIMKNEKDVKKTEVHYVRQTKNQGREAQMYHIDIKGFKRQKIFYMSDPNNQDLHIATLFKTIEFA